MGMSRKTFPEPLYTTLRLLKQHGACGQERGCGRGYDKLYQSLTPAERRKPNAPIPLLRILDSNGLDDALWSLCAVPDSQAKRRDKFVRLLACDYAERVLRIYEAKYPGDMRPRNCIEVSRRYAHGIATAEELSAARTASWAAAGAAAGAAVWAAELAAELAAAGAAVWAATGAATGAAVWAAVWAAAGAATGAATGAAELAAERAAVWAAAGAAARDAERKWQAAHLRKMLMEEGDK